jgi:hypothetical protein
MFNPKNLSGFFSTAKEFVQKICEYAKYGVLGQDSHLQDMQL